MSRIPMPRSLQEIVGALLFASETPLTATELRNAIRATPQEDGEEQAAEVYRTCTSREVEEAIKGLGKALDVAGCGFSLQCAGGAYRLQTVPACGRYVRTMLKLDRPGRLGRATLETLAIIAYRQPITKSEIEEIRGVDVGGNIKILMEAALIRLVGKSELPGHPFLYGTTAEFLEHFGLPSLGALDEFDPTLQRSDPKAKAATYKRTDDEPDASAGESDSNPSVASPEDAKKDVSGEDAADGPEEQLAATVQQDGAGQDGIFIDDTEDEFDEEDEDGEEDFDEDADDGD